MLDNSGQLDYSTDEGVTWIANALSTLADGYFTALFKYHNPTGQSVIYLGTKEGPFYLDYGHAAWIETTLFLPFHDFNCKGAESFRDSAYFPSGMSVYEYHTNPDYVRLVGLDRDAGMPSDYTGSIIKILRGHNYMYAFVDATATAIRDLYPAGQYGDITIYEDEGYSAVMRWTAPSSESKGGWSVAHLGSAAATPISASVIATADDIYRLWFGIDNTVTFIPLQETIQNPKELTTFPFGLTSEHITSWFDADNAVIDKLAFELAGYYEDLAADNQEYVMLYYATDYDDDTWMLLTNSTFTDGKIDVTGETVFTFASDAGLSFKAIRFRELMFRRGSDNTKSPDARWLRLKYIKLLEPKYARTVQLDCSRNYRYQTARTMVSNLEAAVATKTLGAFTFKNGRASETHQVRISNMRGITIGGKVSQGLFAVELVAP